MKQQEYVPADAAAKKLGVHLTTVHRWARSGFLKFIRKGGVVHISEASITTVSNARDQFGLQWMTILKQEPKNTQLEFKQPVQTVETKSPIASTLRELAIKALDSNQTFGWKLMDVAREAYTLKI